MTRHCKSLVYPLLEEIFVSNHAEVTDDEYADLFDRTLLESIDELIEYLTEMKEDLECHS